MTMQKPFESKAEITEVVNKLTTLSNQYERGQRVDWPLIEEIIGNRYHPDGGVRPAIWYIIRKWQKILRRERDIVVRVDLKHGVRLLTHKEVVNEVPAFRQRKAERQLDRALREISTVDPTRLSDHERKILAIQQQNMKAERRNLRRSRHQPAKRIGTEVNPRRPIPPRYR
jgi:hypothetical protein